ncbi:MAG TPA: GH116 family glycosyl-hydrolase [Armatimonadota bacterium]|jgi:uncharacterized protein (DUF608 family)
MRDNRLESNQRTFEGDCLRTIAFPLGGIGTGTVSMGGRGNLQDWEIFNHPGKGHSLPLSFFALWCRPDGQAPVTRILERQYLKPFHHAHGISPSYLGGLPRFRDASFTGEYPSAYVTLADEAIPLEISMRAWNPMIPMNADDSGIPIALFEWKLHNHTDAPMEIALAFNVLNPVGWDGLAPLDSRRAPFLGGNRNTIRTGDGLTGVVLTNDRLAMDDPRYGSIAISSPEKDAEAYARWRRGAWFDDAQWFWNRFSHNGTLDHEPDLGPTPDGETDIATVIVRRVIPAGELHGLDFSLSWSFPNLRNTWNTEPEVAGKPLGNYYAVKFPDAWSAAAYVQRERLRLDLDTQDFQDWICDDSLPPELTDAVSANMSIVRTTTVTRTADGRMNAFEGCSDGAGCCPMNCTHVWNYAQTVAALYPELERSVRDTDYLSNTDSRGDMAFRTLLPLVGQRWAFRAAADGQMGTILRLYREWLNHGDLDWLRSLWPAARRSLEFAWSPDNPDRWDADKDGVMEGIQHNTYDIEFVGPNTLMGSWYLAALVAAAHMADALGETDSAEEYRALARRGAVGHDVLWNGEYYEQHVRFDPAVQGPQLTRHAGQASSDETGPFYQYGAGCLSDQLTGQWFAHCLGLGHVLPADKVRSAAEAIYGRNFRSDLSRHASCQRTYALNDEAGLLMCTWPNGQKPGFPFPYADEVWTGIEYAVAALLIYEGLVDEGLSIVRATRDRHNGSNRNPWDECECGHHYTRAMASWSLLTAYTGFQYSAPDASIGFAPCVPGNLRTFFAAGTAWGQWMREDDRQYLIVSYGTLTLKRWRNAAGTATLKGEPVAAYTDGSDTVFDPPVTLHKNDYVAVV